LFRRLAATWGSLPATGSPRFASDITDDQTPFEFSVALDGGTPEVRFLLEAQGAVPSLASNWEAAQRLNSLLSSKAGVSLARWKAVADLFAPTADCSRFALWHAVCLPSGQKPEFKVYANPQARGPTHSHSVVREAMSRLGLRAAFARTWSAAAPPEYCYFSLDLSAGPQARAKIYVAHRDASPDQIDAAVAGAVGYTPGRAADFCRAMADADGPFSKRPVITCLSFVEGSPLPTVATVHFPVRSYARDDGIVRERVLRHLRPEAAAPYARALEAFATRPLKQGIGMQTYASLRLTPERDRLTVYLAPEVYDVRPSRTYVRQKSRSKPRRTR
jgi:DMATS type aromatic prenyltransferase